MPRVKDRIYSRPPWERMMHIHERIKDGAYPNCTTLGREIEVVIRTIMRDLDFMRYRLNLPIEYDEIRHGFYYSKPVDQFPSLPMTEAEIFGLLVAHKAIAQYHGTPFQKPLETAFKKLTGQLGRQEAFTIGDMERALSFRPFAPEDTDLAKFQVLTTGLQMHRVIRFQYKNLGTKRHQPRQARPYHLACIENHWYLFAFDIDRQAMRTFALTRLARPELTGRRFKPPKDFNLDEYLKGSFSVFKGTDDYEVAIDFDEWATDLIRGRHWHESQEFIELPGGCSRLRFRLNSLEEMERWVLTWGTHATVVRPRVLAERLRQTADLLAKRYEQPTAQTK